jgi:hypothetical protein
MGRWRRRRRGRRQDRGGSGGGYVEEGEMTSYT